MAIGATRLELVPVLEEFVRKRLRVLDNLLCICLPGRLRRLQEGGCDTRDSVIVWPTLACGEYSIVHAFLKIFVRLAVLAEEDKASTWPAECFVSTRSDILTSPEERPGTHVVVVTTSQYSKGLESF